jgi:type VI secretion system protein ImpA
VRLYGFAGLRDGFRLYRELADRFWETAYPADEGDGPAGRVATMGGLNGDANRDGALRFPIYRVALTDGKGVALSAFQYEYAISMEQLPPERKQQRIDGGQVSLQAFEAAAQATGSGFASELTDDLSGCIQEFDKLVVLLEAKCGADAPPSSKIREALQKCRTIVESIYKDRMVSSEPLAQADPGSGRSALAPPDLTGPIASRNQAFRMIEEIAQFFRKTEPHSPLIYALEQVVRWGKLPLPQLLSELIPDDGARSRLFELIGIRPEEKSDGQ